MMNLEKPLVSRVEFGLDERPVRPKQVHLSDTKKLELVQKFYEGALHEELAAYYGVERRTVGRIIRRHQLRVDREAAAASDSEAS